MITNLIIHAIVIILGAIFSGFDIVEKLPTVAGYDVDSALVMGMGYINTVVVYMWPLYYMFQGFVVLMGYYGLKMILRLFIGHRTPGH